MTAPVSYWRKMAAPIIARVITEIGTDDMRALHQALREAYPLGPKRMHPYKVWRDEIRRQLSPTSTAIMKRKPPIQSPGQLSIFGSKDPINIGAQA